jgi:hypothetical protein
MKYQKIAIWRAFLPKTSNFFHPHSAYPPTLYLYWAHAPTVPVTPTLILARSPISVRHTAQSFLFIAFVRDDWQLSSFFLASHTEPTPTGNSGCDGQRPNGGTVVRGAGGSGLRGCTGCGDLVRVIVFASCSSSRDAAT